MADLKKVILEQVRSGSGQSTYVVASQNLGKASVEKFLQASNIPYNRVYSGGGKVYAKIPSSAVKIVGIYGQQTVYVDSLGQPVSIDPSLVDSEATYVNYPTESTTVNPQTGERVPVSVLQPETQQGIYGGVLSPEYVSKGSGISYIEAGPVSFAGTAGQPVTQVTERGLPARPEDYGTYIYEQATEIERAQLHAQTFLSPRGWDYLASYPVSYAVPGQRGPRDIVLENLNQMTRISTEEERLQYVFTSAAFNPPAEIGYALLGGLTLGAATTAIPKLGAFAGSKVGKGAALALTGAYVGSVGLSVSGKLGQNELTGAGGDILRAGSEITGMVSGFSAGQKIGGRISLEWSDPGLGRGAKIARSLEGTRSEWLRSPESIDIKGLGSLTGREKSMVFESIRGTGSTVFGSTAKQSQHMTGLVRSAKDIDIGAPSTVALESRLPRVKGDPFDIHPVKELRNFPHARDPLRAPGGTKITSLSEEVWRSLYAARDRGGRPGWQGMKDINRFYLGARSLAESMKIQAMSSRFFKGYKIRKAERLIRQVEEFRLESPKITERLVQRGELPKLEFSSSSYLPRGASRLPSLSGRSASPTRSSRSRVPDASRLSGSSRTPRSTSPITGGGSSILRTSFRPPPSSRLTPPSYQPARGGGPSPPPFFAQPPRTRKKSKASRPARLPGLPQFSSGSRGKKGDRGQLSARFGYVPSLTGFVLGGTIPKAPKISSGLGIRAPVRRKKK